VNNATTTQVEDRGRLRKLAHAAGVWSAATRYAAVLVLLVAIFILFSISQNLFFTSANLQNLLTSVSILWVVSMGMTFVVLTGGIDLSVGSLLALSGLILSKLFNSVGMPSGIAIVLTLAAGALIGGGVNGVLIGRFKLSFFVVTLGTLSLYAGIVNIWSGYEDDVHQLVADRQHRVREGARRRGADLVHARDARRLVRRTPVDVLRP